MQSIPQSIQVIQSQRSSDLVGHCQRSERLYELLTVEEQALRDVVVSF